MPRSFFAHMLITVLFLAGAVWGSWGGFQRYELPFTLGAMNAGTARIYPNAGTALPSGIRPGDEVELEALDTAARTAVVISDLQGAFPPDRTYQLVIRRAGVESSVPATVVPTWQSESGLVSNWILFGSAVLMSALALLLLWRGRDISAAYMVYWLTTTLLGFAFNYGFPLDSAAGLAVQSFAIGLFTFNRVAFYLMIETLVGQALSPRARRFVRICFAFILALGVATFLGGHLLYAVTGWAGLMHPGYGALFSAVYLVPTLTLLYGYGNAEEAQKPQLRWLLLSTAFLLISIFLSNSPLLDFITSQVVQNVFICLGICGFTYAVLRHRMLDVRVVIDRTLVYGATTALVVGVVAAMNSLALRATLGENTGLLLQIVIPLALGIVLGKVRAWLDRVVEQVFFRRKYLAEKALRAFGRQAGHMQDPSRLLEAAARELQRNMGAPAVALYSAERTGYHLLKQAGAEAFPEVLDLDDAALVALRTEREAVDLPDVASVLGSDGCVFPMIVLGNLQGALVCRNRPGEHFAQDERKLLTRVAGEVGAAWRILRARDNEALVVALAKGGFPTLEAARSQAEVLTVTWARA